MTTRATRRAEITAYHEAGHGVAALLFDHSFAHVSIIPNECSNGRVIYEEMPDDIQEAVMANDYGDARVAQWIEQSLIITLSGPMAQRRHAPRSDWRHGMGGNKDGGLVAQGSDLQSVMRGIDDLHGYAANRKVAEAYEARANNVSRSAATPVLRLWVQGA